MNEAFDPATLADDLYEVRRIYNRFLPPWMKPIGSFPAIDEIRARSTRVPAPSWAIPSEPWGRGLSGYV